MDPKPFIHNLTRDELQQACFAFHHPAFRADQVWRWLYIRRVTHWEEMKNIPASLRQALAEKFSLEAAVMVRSEGERRMFSTRKVLVSLQDGQCVETVLIPAKGRTTVCVSSQVGCKFDCAFCASGKGGFQRHLRAGEMVGQILIAARELGGAPAHVVWMGIGEPLDNYDQVLTAIRIINDPEGLSIGARRITLSTCGIIPGIRRLADEGLQVELSVSLHAPDDALRSRLMPVNRVYPLGDLLQACRDYADKTGRLITFEYILIKGGNDSVEQARALARLLRPVHGARRAMHGRVNLIHLSAVAEYDGRPSPPAVADMFIAVLKRAGINVTVRVSKGTEVHAACGQLRYSRLADLR